MSDSNQDRIVQSAGRSWRLILIFVLLLVVAAGIVSKLVSLYTLDQAFLQRQGDARSLRTTLTPAHRGLITDRNGEPLAVSAPVATIWANPSRTDRFAPELDRLAVLLGVKRQELVSRLENHQTKQFIYLKRQVTPELAEQIDQLNIGGIHVDREYKRYYPAGEVTTHLVGFTGIDGSGQEGMELAYERALTGHPGKKLVMQDRLGRTIKHIKSLDEAKPGRDVQLSIDLHLQYMAYRELKAVVQSHHADSASAVVLDARTGEVLAMVNQPSYNPNDRSHLDPKGLRNRAVTDLFEPGSTVKPLTIAAALMSGQYTVDSIVDTTPGYIRVKGRTIRDHRDYGKLDLTGIITKSSNVGITKLALSMHADAVRNLYENVGLGQATGSGFPGERAGSLPYYPEKRVVERATMSYGYGLSVTPLQLAQSYIPLANDGIALPVSLLKLDEPATGKRVMPADVAHSVLEMMETVISPVGTGRRAAVYGYRVAGKTGTVHKAMNGGYSGDQYISVFSGVVPISDPRLVIAVMVNNPRGQEYYGGEVAAPVFSRVAGNALRMLNVAPDQWPEKPSTTVVMK
ncbi:penicillin-binding transpeptidase domain-containing protein [Neptunomonas phycophila]|uniref:peptidoglycan D,D-transpeptidase FtsI family protein n=1 Tax=Neptunomonas phycophila TaxID=1572645 RepID=UPI0026E3765F|nr:penicillin-binding transpeptidase domain-containing protein [Neptunomonas phycophila]MDO6782731.1 penicillin-binding transpeptidase domain-containing protein [Neptunomonas phycophila]